MDKIHAAATHHLPGFITEPGSSDVLMIVAALVLILAVLGAGVFFLWLHSLPERLVHNKLQYDLVAVLALLSLFTHIHAFWIAALLLTFVTIPDLSKFDPLTPLRSIAKSLKTLADQSGGTVVAAPSPAPAPQKISAPGDDPVAKEG